MTALTLDASELETAFAPPPSPLAEASLGGITFRAIHAGRDVWLTIGWGDDAAGLVWRAPLLSDAAEVRVIADGHLIELAAETPLGRHRITVDGHPGQFDAFLLRHRFTPRGKLHVPYLPRDLTVARFDERAHRPRGKVEARQRRLNTGLCYFDVTEPMLGKVLYVQDWTELNGYFAATGTKPENAVGGPWPQVGYLPPTQPQDPATALPAGKEVVLNHAHIVIRRFPQQEENESAWQFLDMLAATYRHLRKPAYSWRDWTARARGTLRDLSRSPKARTRHFGQVYFHPYTASENPDSMVQLTLLSAIREWSRWSGRRHPLEAEIRAGLDGFFDPKLRTLRRYLPDVPADKDADAVDSWYLYHPLMSLANLALDGDEAARELFFACLDFGIRAARHFHYRWPILFKIDSFAVIRPVAEDQRGQTDVGGIYAWVMLQAFELSGEARYLDEAKTGIDAADGLRFDLNYQANLTAWGAAACIRLWRITNDRHYLAKSYVYLAAFFHNAQMWSSDIGFARHYENFMAVTCLQDAPYAAIYECFDSFAAFERYLDLGGPDLIPSAKLLVAEYCRYALDRAWYYYPDALPKEALAGENRNGHIDRTLSFPLEDLYPDGQPAGQVGQEIYGAGAAMVFATRAFHRIPGAPFTLHCDRFLRALVRVDERAVSFAIDGAPGCDAELTVIFQRRDRVREVALRAADGTVHRAGPGDNERQRRFTVLAAGDYVLSW